MISGNSEFFKKYAPIGCRDNATRALFRQAGIDAYTSGCLSITLPHRGQQPDAGCRIFVAGEDAENMPPELRSHVPSQIMEGSVYVHQRERVTSCPLSDDDTRRIETMAVDLIERYHTQASLVVAPAAARRRSLSGHGHSGDPGANVSRRALHGDQSHACPCTRRRSLHRSIGILSRSISTLSNAAWARSFLSGSRVASGSLQSFSFWSSFTGSRPFRLDRRRPGITFHLPCLIPGQPH